MTFERSGEFDDVLEDVVLQGVVTVTTTETEFKVGVSPESDRELLRLYNDSNDTVYVGPTGVTTSGATRGEPLKKGQWMELPVGSSLSIYGIVAAGTADVIVWEIG